MPAAPDKDLEIVVEARSQLSSALLTLDDERNDRKGCRGIEELGNQHSEEEKGKRRRGIGPVGKRKGPSIYGYPFAFWPVDCVLSLKGCLLLLQKRLRATIFPRQRGLVGAGGMLISYLVAKTTTRLRGIRTALVWRWLRCIRAIPRDFVSFVSRRLVPCAWEWKFQISDGAVSASISDTALYYMVKPPPPIYHISRSKSPNIRITKNPIRHPIWPPITSRCVQLGTEGNPPVLICRGLCGSPHQNPHADHDASEQHLSCPKQRSHLEAEG